MIAKTRLHRWRNPQRLVHPTEVVMHIVQRNRVPMILQLLAKTVRQPGETPHRHAHREILTLYKRRADML